MSEKIVQLNEAVIKSELKELVRGSRWFPNRFPLKIISESKYLNYRLEQFFPKKTLPKLRWAVFL